MKKISVSEYRALAKKPKRSKYRAVRTRVDNIWFDSRGEAQRWHKLKLRERAGEIMGLCRQIKFPLAVGTQILGYYVADFAYWEIPKRYVIEEYKGIWTPLAKWKLAHFRLQYPYEVRITGAAKR